MKKILLLSFIILTVASCSYHSGLGVPPINDQYEDYSENPFVMVIDSPITTFSVDADGGSYGVMRKHIKEENTLPPPESVRVEEYINYFNFDYPSPTGIDPIALNGEVSHCPWSDSTKLIRIGIKGKETPRAQLPNTNFVFLVDVSGSMQDADKLDLIKESMEIFVEQMRDNDRVAIVTYSGSTKVKLESTDGTEKDKIKKQIKKLSSGGSTNGAAGINLAYDVAEANFIQGGNNRILLTTDGDFNLGLSSTDELVALIEEKRKSGVFLTTIGVGLGNFNDAMMEQLANNGNGTYEYLGDLDQAEKIFTEDFGKFYTVAKDVKVQVTFNPTVVKSYRLIGYENRSLANNDFTDDSKDAGEIGDGQTITALYEIVTVGNLTHPSEKSFTIDFRYKKPDSEVSIPMTLEIKDDGNSFEVASENMRFAATCAGYGMLLKESQYKGNLTFDDLINWGQNAKTHDPYGNRAEFISIMQTAKGL